MAAPLIKRPRSDLAQTGRLITSTKQGALRGPILTTLLIAARYRACIRFAHARSLHIRWLRVVLFWCREVPLLEKEGNVARPDFMCKTKWQLNSEQ